MSSVVKTSPFPPLSSPSPWSIRLPHRGLKPAQTVRPDLVAADVRRLTSIPRRIQTARSSEPLPAWGHPRPFPRLRFLLPPVQNSHLFSRFKSCLAPAQNPCDPCHPWLKPPAFPILAFSLSPTSPFPFPIFRGLNPVVPSGLKSDSRFAVLFPRIAHFWQNFPRIILCAPVQIF